MYTNLDELKAFLGADADGLMKREDIERRLADCEIRMLAYILPNSPAGEAQLSAFCQAVYDQLEHEMTGPGAQLFGMPEGVTSFTVNGFSATLTGAHAGGISPAGISPGARARLLRAGLMYRGVNLC